MNIPAIRSRRTRLPRTGSILLALLVIFAAGMLGWAPAQAAPAAHDRPSPRACQPRVDLSSWRSEEQLARSGFIVERYGDPASVTFGRNTLGLSLATAPSQSTYAASRITEIDPHPPIAERTRCWQPSEDRAVEVRYRVRFEQAVAPPELIANLVLWNSPFPFQDGSTQSNETAIPVTSFGVSRLYGMYVAAATQDFDAATGAGMFMMAPMPAWLDPAQWHEVTVLLTRTTVDIKVTQRGQRATVLSTPLLRAPDPLGFQLSIDNDALGAYSPINQGDGIEVDRLSIRYRSHHD